MSQEQLIERERISAEAAAAKLGISLRTVQEMAARGDIPGAAKFTRVWTFDLKKLRDFIEQKEMETWENAKRQPDATGAAKSSGVRLGGVAVSSAGRLKQMIQQSQKRVTKRAKREQ